MKRATCAGLLVVVCCALLPAAARAADEFNIENLALCKESWQDWKDDQARMKKMGESLDADYARGGSGGAYKPKGPKTLFGMPVTELYPASIGIAVGIAVVVAGDFNTTRKNVEKALGKSFKKCDSGEGMKTCELELAPKRTVLLFSSEKADAKSTLVGCAYYYEK